MLFRSITELNDIKAECENQKNNINKLIGNLEVIYKNVKVKFDNDNTKAYKAIKDLEELSIKETEINNLCKIIEDYELLYIQHERKETLKELSDDIQILKLKKDLIRYDLETAKAKSIISIIESKKDIINSGKEITNIRASNKYASQLNEVLEKISNIILESKRKFNKNIDIKEKEILEANNCIKFTREQLSILTKTNDLTKNIFKDVKIPEVKVVEDIKKLELMMEEIDKKEILLKNKEKEIRQNLDNYKVIIEMISDNETALRKRINENESQLKTDRLHIEEEIKSETEIIMTIIEDIKDESLKSIENNEIIMNYSKVEHELKEIHEILNFKIKELSDQLEVSKIGLKPIKTKIQYLLANQIISNNVCLICSYGKTGHVKLDCGHYRCVQCVARKRNDKKIPCELCKNEIRNIGMRLYIK